MRISLYALALAGVSSFGSAAIAQVAGQGPVTVAPPTAAEAAPPAQPDGQVGLADIVVTAQRREESLQKVPVAVTAISSEQLDQLRVTNVKNLAGIAPSLQIQTQGLQSNPSIAIRGVASGVSNNAVDPKVGIYLDGVYIGRTVGSIFDLADIARVEVLRGPQGTLFGRNATAGAISLVSATPKGEWGLRATGSYGNYNQLRGKAVLDLPAFGPFSVKIAYLHDEIEGDYRNLIGGRSINLGLRIPAFGTQTFSKKLGGRNIDGGQLAIRGDFGNLTADYRFDYTDARSTGRGMQSFGVIPDQSGQILGPIVALQPAFGGITNISATRLPAIASASSEEHVVTQGHSLTLSVNATDNFTVKSITAFRKFKQDPNIFDLAATGGLRLSAAQFGALITPPPGPDATPAQIAAYQAGLATLGTRPGANDTFFSLLTARRTRQEQFSQEVQFQLDGESFELTAGVFYFHENSPADDILGILEPSINGTIVPLPFDNAFGSGVTSTRSINDSIAGYGQLTFHLTDTLDITGGLRGTIDDRELIISAISGGQGAVLGTGDYKVSYQKINYTGIVTWRPTTQSTVYGKISSGYVAGGILSGIPYKPETLVSYELGAKTQLFDNRVRLNAAVFYSDYKDLQTQNFINGRQAFDNAGKAKIKGFEVETEIAPVRGLVISGSVGYSDLDYDTFVLAGREVADVARTTYNSVWTGRAAVQYDSPDIGNVGHLQGRLEGRYRSRYFLTSTPLLNLAGQEVLEEFNRRPGYWLVDGRLGLVDIPVGGARASLSVFGQNIFNERYVSFGAPVLSLVGTYERGRTYGVELGFAF
ncbi:TonB-dependent receptor [Sphingomonas jatrophae]|uniref:Iron complex outermembrane recepter protein n=1 Tax=Sphingomonas jatrophae TaxID=1166337 RepID=A0A1I6KIL9_9SPHN|nr:TonB-dependent receptor [Sphingomonas jatrophae]SFR91014.1 iron complex outermembrane recepter protein [Sphingomonas jatrophae]